MDPNPSFSPVITKLLSFSLQKTLDSLLSKTLHHCQIDQIEPISNELFPLLKTLKIQTAWRMKRMALKFKIKQKKLKHRGYIIKEILSSEENLAFSLELIVQNVIKPSTKEKILNKNEIHILFSHLENIALFTKELSNSLKARLTNKNKLFLDIFLQYYDFFKLYSPYINNFPDAQNLLNEMRNNIKHPFNKLLKKVEYSPLLQNLSLLDQLIKPVQRLPKYVLLFRDLKKNTETTHPDYMNISLSLEKSIALNKENNQKMEEYLKQLRLFELQRSFGSKDLNLFDKHRKFLKEESLYLLQEDLPLPITLYILSDLLLVVEIGETGSRILSQLRLDSNSFVCDLQNTRSIKWLFSVYGINGGVVFNSDTKAHKKEVMDFLEVTIESHSNKGLTKEIQPLWNEGLRLKTLGTLKRGLRGFKAYTLYIIEVKIGGIRDFRLYLRFSELIELEEIIKARLPGIKVPHFTKTLSNFFMSQNYKVIETRKLMIESFMQTLLQNREFLNKERKLLCLLSLPKDFHLFKEQSSFILPLLNKGNNGLFEELYNRFYRTRILWKGVDEKTIPVKIMLIDNRTLDLKFHEGVRCIEACKEISRVIGLVCWLDFKLFLTNIKKKEEFLLDDEELLFKASEFVEEKEADFLSKISMKIKGLKRLLNGSDYILIFKKQGYFGREREMNSLENDPKRLDLCFLQYYQEFLDSKYPFHFNERLFLCSLRLYTIYHSLPKDFTLSSSMLKEILPNDLINSKSGVKSYEIRLKELWERIGEEIEKNSSKISREIDISIAKKLFLGFLQREKLFGGNLYWVSLLKKDKTPLKNGPEYLWLVIKLEGVILMHPNEKSVILKEFPLNEIEETFTYPNSLKILLKNKEKWRFMTNNSYEIGDLLNKYKEIINIS